MLKRNQRKRGGLARGQLPSQKESDHVGIPTSARIAYLDCPTRAYRWAILGVRIANRQPYRMGDCGNLRSGMPSDGGACISVLSHRKTSRASRYWQATPSR